MLQVDGSAMWTGELVGIFIAPFAKATMVPVSEVRAIPGRGLEGDRYFLGQGTFSRGYKPDAELTLIESEAVAALAREESIALQHGEPRRNLVTRSVALNHLVGREFMVGDVRMRGHRLCEPCTHLAQVTGQEAIVRALLHRAGLRAQVLTEGTLRAGDPIRLA